MTGEPAPELPAESDEPEWVTALDLPMHRRIVWAYDLYVEQGHNLEDTAALMGCHPSSVWRYVQKGRAAMTFLTSMDENANRIDHAVILKHMRGFVNAEREVTKMRASEYVPLLLSILKAERDLLGLNMPSRVTVGGVAEPAGVDEATIGAMAAYRERTDPL